MKKLLLLASMFAASAAYADITINLSAGELFESDGTTAFPMNGLLQLVVSTQDSLFTTPTPSSFTGGSADDMVLASFGANDFAGPGSAQAAITFALNSAITTGDPLLLRWWPTLTTASLSPGAGTSFGQFRTDAIENSSDISWNVPADGATDALNFVTMSYAGTEPDSAGIASMMTAAVPEPSTFALGALGVLGLVFLRRRRPAKS
jgi:hypothetical protein